jgi:ketopantoate hydroxymethyltransferase
VERTGIEPVASDLQIPGFACDYQVARIVDRAAVDIVSVGDSVGVNVWGREDEADVTAQPGRQSASPRLPR